MADIKKSAAQLIGRTPLLEASNYAESQGIADVVLLAKLEYLNPAGSVKDRVALSMIEDAEKSGSSELFKAYIVTWNLTDNGGRRLRPGVYLYRAAISTNNSKEATKANKLIILAQ